MACPRCGGRSYLCEQCRLEELGRRWDDADFSTPEGVRFWVMGDGDDVYCASIENDGKTITTACCREIDLPIDDSVDSMAPHLAEGKCPECVERVEQAKEDGERIEVDTC